MSPPRRLAIAAGTVGALLLCTATPSSVLAKRPEPAPLRGPIADFWNQVKRDWSDAIPGLRAGSDQTYEWVSLVYGASGEDDALDDLLEREMHTWAKWQRRTWVRSMFWKKSYDRLNREGFYGSRALRKNLVVMGTPGDNPMLVEMTDGTPFRLEADGVRIGNREYRGPSLVLAFIRPNPLGDGTYALVLSATRSQALLDLGRLPLGPTDYVLFRGAHAIESGFLDWSDPDSLSLGEEREVNPDHDGWTSFAEGSLTVHFNPLTLDEETARRTGRAHAARLPQVARLLGAPRGAVIDEYVYFSAEEKLRQTGQPGPVSVDLAGGAVHQVVREGIDPPAWPLAMVAAWQAWGPTDLRGLLRGIALLVEPEIEGQPLDAWAARLAARGELPEMEDLFKGERRPTADGEEALALLGLGSFLSSIVDEHGMDGLARFYSEARANSFRAVFREEFGTSLGRAERAWRSGLPAPPATLVVAAQASGTAAQPTEAATLEAEGEALFLDRRDAEAELKLRRAVELDPARGRAWMLLSRIAFRGGHDDEALAAGTEAARLGDEDPSVAAWSRVTLGRAHAARGDLLAARLELTDPALDEGPEGPRVLADFWLENLGLSPNRRAAAAYLAEQAEIDLQYYDWDAAEARVLQILAADPGNAPAHHQLARIRLHRFGYWYHFARLYNELFPGTPPSDPQQYWYLVQSSTRESYKGAYLEAGAFSPLDLDRDKGAFPGDEKFRDLFPRAREPGTLHDATQHVLRARAYYLAKDWRRAASQARLALELRLPVSDTRAWALFFLGEAEAALGNPEEGRAHIDEALAMRPTRALREQLELSRKRLELAGED